MKSKRGFDEVMIVNPSGPTSDTTQRVRLMRFHNVYPSDMGYYGEVDPLGYYGEADPIAGYYGQVDPLAGYYGQVDPMAGYYGEVEPLAGYYGQVDPLAGYYGQVDPMAGYYGEVDPTFGYGEPEPVGYFAEEFPVGYYGEEFPVGAYGEELPLGYYGENPYQPVGYYGQAPEMVGYGYGGFAENYPGTAYGEPAFGGGYDGYVRDVPPAFNAGCPLPTNLSGFDEAGGFDGYTSPSTVNPSCDQLTPQPGSSPSPPETFKPLW